MQPILRKAIDRALDLDFADLDIDYLTICRQLWAIIQDFIERTPKSGWSILWTLRHLLGCRRGVRVPLLK